MRTTWLTLTFLLVSTVAKSQFTEFEMLKAKGDSAYETNDFSLSLKYYDQAEALPKGKRPNLDAGFYYDKACVYSLNKVKDSALDCLEKSFRISNQKGEGNPVKASHILKDRDLAFVRQESRFVSLLYKYYPKTTLDFLSQKEVSYDLLIRYLAQIDHGSERPEISDKIIYWAKDGGDYTFNNKVKSVEIPQVQMLKDRPLEVVNCTFKMNLVWANFQRAKQTIPFELLLFQNCTFEGRVVFSEILTNVPPRFLKCTFQDDLHVDVATTKDYWDGFALDSCSIKDAVINIKAESPVRVRVINSYSTDSTFIKVSVDNAEKIDVRGNMLPKGTLLVQSKNLNNLALKKNLLNDFVLQDCRVQSEFDFLDNSILGHTLLHDSYFSNDPVNDIDWSSLDSLKLGYLETAFPTRNDYVVLGGRSEGVGRLSDFNFKDDVTSYEVISGEKQEDIIQKQSYTELMGMYSSFLNLYKNKYDIESYNGCLFMMKELQSKRIEYLYRSHPTFDNYFRWKLSQLMKFYVRYGTDPARAIVISIYIILVFGIFFFFFPSDWDTTSKKKLIQNFKDFIEKNEKGYIKPFFILLWGCVLSLFNGLTLSLNAFITLGFGNIPTHGVARYVCVLEGFLGWFLLSIFTVALINQVL